MEARSRSPWVRLSVPLSWIGTVDNATSRAFARRCGLRMGGSSVLRRTVNESEHPSQNIPRMGKDRELKFALESFWKGKTSEADLLSVAKNLRSDHWLLQKTAGISIIPSNDFSLYDQVLDALVLIGATPERFGNQAVSLAQYFAMARNSNEQTAMEMTKWFDTNYHYLVPEWTSGLSFVPDTTKLLNEVREARELGIETRPVLIGPVWARPHPALM
jgi:5-methyltetrahydropteroyltriglutamate--homocysteine methyltransferase